jgi:hypothetical protein
LLEIPAVDHFEMGLGIAIVLSCRRNERRRSVNAIDFSYGRREIRSKFAIATAHVEDMVTGLRVEILQYPLGEFGHERGCSRISLVDR